VITDDRARELREEEEMRVAVREEIAKRDSKPKTRTEHILGFLNTSVGAFLLSTVLVGLFSYSQSEIATARVRNAERQERQRKVRLEIANRLDEITRMAAPFDGHYYTVVRTAFDGFRPGDTVNESYRVYYSAMFPELRERTLKSLVYEFMDLAPNDQEKKKIRLLLPVVQQLRNYYDRLSYDEIPAGPHTRNRLPIEVFSLTKEDLPGYRSVMAKLKPLRSDD
jgi:hypothetical protein